jgi:hypothetical protein
MLEPQRRWVVFWCIMAVQRGWTIEETANTLLEASAKAQERARLHKGANPHKVFIAQFRAGIKIPSGRTRSGPLSAHHGAEWRCGGDRQTGRGLGIESTPGEFINLAPSPLIK